MKKETKVLSTFSLKSIFIPIVLFIIFLLPFQGCKKNDVSVDFSKINAAKEFYESSSKSFIANGNSDFKNLSNAKIFWDKTKVEINEEGKELVTVPLEMKEKFFTKFKSDERRELNNLLSLQLTKIGNNKYSIEEVVTIPKNDNIGNEVLIKFNLMTGEETAFSKFNNQLKKGSITL